MIASSEATRAFVLAIHVVCCMTGPFKRPSPLLMRNCGIPDFSKRSPKLKLLYIFMTNSFKFDLVWNLRRYHANPKPILIWILMYLRSTSFPLFLWLHQAGRASSEWKIRFLPVFHDWFLKTRHTHIVFLCLYKLMLWCSWLIAINLNGRF